jgi:hypothetical protein
MDYQLLFCTATGSRVIMYRKRKRQIKMSILTENIKLYNPLNNRYLLYNSIILIALFLIIPLNAHDVQIEMTKSLADNNLPFIPIMFLFMSMFIYGAMITIMQAEVMTRQFAACLPALHNISTRFVLIFGLIANLIYLAVFIYLPHPAGINGLLYYISIFTSGLLFYFMAVYFTLYSQFKREKAFLAILITVFLFVLISVMVAMGITYAIDSLLYILISLIVLCQLSLFALLKMLKNPDFKRSLILNLSLFNLVFSPQTTAQNIELYKSNRLSLKDEKEETNIEMFLLKQLEKLQPLTLIKSIGTRFFYKIVQYYICNNHNPTILIAGMLIISSIIILLGGYHAIPVTYDKTGVSFTIFLGMFAPLMFPCLGILLLYIFVGLFLNPEKNNHLFPEGRSEHFCSSLIIWLLKPVTIVAWVTLVILIAKVFKYYIPDFTLAGVSFKYIAPGFSMILWVLVITPVMDLFMFNIEKPRSVITALIFLPVLLVLSLFSIFGVNPFYASFAMVLAIVISNGFFIERLWRYWFKKDIELLD